MTTSFVKGTLLVAALASSVALAQISDPAAFAASKFDVIIAGGGTAGLVLANRLSSTSLRIGVIEAGHFNPAGDPLIDTPFAPGSLINDPSASAIGNPNYDWSFVSVPQQGRLNGSLVFYPRYALSTLFTCNTFLKFSLGVKFLEDLLRSTILHGSVVLEPSMTHGKRSLETDLTGILTPSKRLSNSPKIGPLRRPVDQVHL